MLQKTKVSSKIRSVDCVCMVFKNFTTLLWQTSFYNCSPYANNLSKIIISFLALNDCCTFFCVSANFHNPVLFPMHVLNNTKVSLGEIRRREMTSGFSFSVTRGQDNTTAFHRQCVEHQQSLQRL